MSEVKYYTLADDCVGDSEGLAAALGAEFEVITENYDDSEGYGHHFADAVFRAHDGRIIHAECGGCSCEGSGSWSYCDSVEQALAQIPEWRRPTVEAVSE